MRPRRARLRLQHPRLLWPQGDGDNRILSTFLGAVGYRPQLDSVVSILAADGRWLSALLILVALLTINGLVVFACRRASTA